MKISSTECKTAARAALIGNYGSAVGFSLCYFIMLIVFSAAISALFMLPSLFQSLRPLTPYQNVLMYYLPVRISTSLVIILELMLMPGFIVMCLDFSAGKKSGIQQLWYGFKHQLGTFLTMALLYTGINFLLALPADLITLVSIEGTPGGPALFVLIIMGLLNIIVTTYIWLNYGLVYWVLIENPDFSLWEGLKHSQQLMKGCRGSYIYMGFSFIGWYLLSGCTMGIGFLWLYPYVVCSFTQFYLKRKVKYQQETILL